MGTSADAQCLSGWQPGGGIPGVDGTVNAIVSWDPDGAGPLPAMTVIAGTFTIAGAGLVQNIAA
ncbi:MAG TPA: hypothetical protein VHC70_07765, partial [Phycisphaerales bacterium]|nr:hypothetical protein [Phycisphaerales bacterium]